MAKILLVEDNELNRDALSRHLRRRGFSVVGAEDGEQGVALAKSEAPDLILLDLDLPVLDGWQAARRIRGEVARHIPIIALSAHSSGGQGQMQAAGCDDYDTKPIQLDRLLGKINALLEKFGHA